MICPKCNRGGLVVADLIDGACPSCDTQLTHLGCAYSVQRCERNGCRPAELCPAGHRVHRWKVGGGHHHHGEAA